MLSQTKFISAAGDGRWVDFVEAIPTVENFTILLYDFFRFTIPVDKFSFAVYLWISEPDVYSVDGHYSKYIFNIRA